MDWWKRRSRSPISFPPKKEQEPLDGFKLWRSIMEERIGHQTLETIGEEYYLNRSQPNPTVGGSFFCVGWNFWNLSQNFRPFQVDLGAPDAWCVALCQGPDILTVTLAGNMRGQNFGLKVRTFRPSKKLQKQQNENIFFDQSGLVLKLTTSSKSSYREIPKTSNIKQNGKG